MKSDDLVRILGLVALWLISYDAYRKSLKNLRKAKGRLEVSQSAIDAFECRSSDEPVAPLFRSKEKEETEEILAISRSVLALSPLTRLGGAIVAMIIIAAILMG